MATAVIVDAVRTAGGKRNGKLSGWHPADLAAETLKALVERNDLDPALDRRRDHGLRHAGRRPGAEHRPQRRARRRACPSRCPSTTVDRQCGSSQQSAHFAAQGVIAGAYDIVVAAGVEVMSLVPMGASAWATDVGFPFGPTRSACATPTWAASCRRASRPSSSPTSGACPAKTSTRSAPAASSCAERATERGPLRERDHPGAGQAARQGDRRGHRVRRARQGRRGHPPRHHRRDARQR